MLFLKKIERAKLKNHKLDSILRDDPRFQIKALSKSGHRGYQKWHRQYDEVIEAWLNTHRDASVNEFLNKLNSFYSKPGMIKIFGKVRF